MYESKNRALDALGQGLMDRLRTLGFSPRVGHDILTKYPVEQVQQGLDNLPYRKARNPAAYLLRELERGDYADPVNKRPVRVLRVLEDTHCPVSTGSTSPSAPASSPAPEPSSNSPQAAADGLPSELRANLMLQARQLAAKQLHFPLDRVKDYNPVAEAYFSDLVGQHVAKLEGVDGAMAA